MSRSDNGFADLAKFLLRQSGQMLRVAPFPFNDGVKIGHRRMAKVVEYDVRVADGIAQQACNDAGYIAGVPRLFMSDGEEGCTCACLSIGSGYIRSKGSVFCLGQQMPDR